jgi:hypothetical protein
MGRAVLRLPPADRQNTAHRHRKVLSLPHFPCPLRLEPCRKARLRLEPESALSKFVAPIPEGNPPQHAFKLIEAAAQAKVVATQPGNATAGQAAALQDLPPAASTSNKNLFERFSAKLAFLNYRCEAPHAGAEWGGWFTGSSAPHVVLAWEIL